MNLSFACPHCSLLMEAEPEFSGMECACPQCSQTFLIPHPADGRKLEATEPRLGAEVEAEMNRVKADLEQAVARLSSERAEAEKLRGLLGEMRGRVEEQDATRKALEGELKAQGDALLAARKEHEELGAVAAVAARRESEITALRTELEGERRGVSQERGRAEELEKGMNRVKADLEQAVARLDSEKAEAQKLRGLLEEMRGQVEEQNAKRKALEGELKAHADALSAARKEHEKLAAEAARRDSEIEVLRVSQEGERRGLSEERGRVEELEKEVVRLQRSLEASSKVAEREAQLQSDRILLEASFEKERQSAREGRERMQGELQKAREQVERLEQSKAVMEQRVTAMERELSAALDAAQLKDGKSPEESRLETEIHGLRGEVADRERRLSEERARFGDELEGARREVAAVRLKLGEAEAQEERLVKEVAQLRHLMKDGVNFEQQYQTFLMERKRLEETLERERSDAAVGRAVLEGELAKVGEVLAKEREGVAAAQARAVASEEEVLLLRRKLTDAEGLAQQHGALVAERDRLQQRVVELNSRAGEVVPESWGATQPNQPISRSGGGFWLIGAGAVLGSFVVLFSAPTLIQRYPAILETLNGRSITGLRVGNLVDGAGAEASEKGAAEELRADSSATLGRSAESVKARRLPALFQGYPIGKAFVEALERREKGVWKEMNGRLHKPAQLLGEDVSAVILPDKQGRMVMGAYVRICPKEIGELTSFLEWAVSVQDQMSEQWGEPIKVHQVSGVSEIGEVVQRIKEGADYYEAVWGGQGQDVQCKLSIRSENDKSVAFRLEFKSLSVSKEYLGKAEVQPSAAQ